MKDKEIKSRLEYFERDKEQGADKLFGPGQHCKSCHSPIFFLLYKVYIMSPLSIQNLVSLIGILPAEGTGSRYADYKLSTVLKVQGFSKPLIFVERRTRSFYWLDKTIHYLMAGVHIALTPDQQKRFFINEKEAFCLVPARYSGSENDWDRICFNYVDDIAIRFSKSENGQLYSLTFTEYWIGEQRYKLQGDRLDWDILESKDKYAEHCHYEGSYSDSRDYVDEEYLEECAEREADLLDAYGDDLSNWHNR